MNRNDSNNHMLTLELFSADISEILTLPFFESDIPAGHPAPADNRVVLKLDLNQHLIKHPAATFYARVRGEKMEELDLDDGDILVVDRALTPRENDIVVCKVDEYFTVKRIHLLEKRENLCVEDEALYMLYTIEDETLNICGVVTYIIHKP
ncbi:DNA polymerase V [Catalinimonas alkaloidigena]|uniref:translesion error-prone DNA polymerase V autoproteolytic subunit n=1 Tax=Catalinimonas alkaloidigena TaxID=1075417 RepID=UPI0024073A89|nr:translesion error-prone DNA polymerase V autoproteolytic subunit [Catalinimonas alkaloidigena]MDF9797389.1 DNA polymerase V [Catalinimonas alkaloidigena]